MTATWDDLEIFVKALCKIQMQETLSPHFTKIVERIEAQSGGADNTKLNSRVSDLEEQIASLKQKISNPPVLKKPEPQQPAVVKREQPQQPKPTPAKTLFESSPSEWE